MLLCCCSLRRLGSLALDQGLPSPAGSHGKPGKGHLLTFLGMVQQAAPLPPPPKAACISAPSSTMQPPWQGGLTPPLTGHAGDDSSKGQGKSAMDLLTAAASGLKAPAGGGKGVAAQAPAAAVNAK